jgi:tyrosyl-tRNA synthetase
MAKYNIQNILTRGVSEIIVEKELRKLLDDGRQLRLKMGFDPSRSDIHLGHAVGLRKLRDFQELGHKVILIVGDWTAQIGDPSGRSATRQMLTAEEVRENAKTYMTQFFKIVDRNRTQVVWQSEWFGEFTLANVFDLTKRFTVAQFLAREDFAKRFKDQKPIAITELLYPLLQAYDSVAIESDVEFGGTDQKFNLLVGRQLQESMGQKPQQCLIMPILVGTDGIQKMSKSLGNYIGIADDPNDMYGKVMSIPDFLIKDYFELVTDTPDQDIKEIEKALGNNAVNPMDLKKKLALNLVSQFNSSEVAAKAQSNFESTIQRGETPQEIPEYNAQLHGTTYTVSLINQGSSFTIESRDGLVSLFDLFHKLGLTSSISEAKRLLGQGALTVDGYPYAENLLVLNKSLIIGRGRRRFIRIINTSAHE